MKEGLVSRFSLFPSILYCPTASGQRIKSLAREKTGVLSLALRQSSDEGKTHANLHYQLS